MEIALINNDSLILGPMGFNVRMINGELEDLELEDRISPQSYLDLPIHFSDGNTHLVSMDRVIEGYDPKYHNIGNFTWEIIKDSEGVPIRALANYPVVEKTLEEVKKIRKFELSPHRKDKENTTITLIINNVQVTVPTSREERMALTSKLSSSPGPYNYKFGNIWLELTSQDLQYILGQIDTKVQEAFDWELSKINQIEACQTIDEVYDVVVREIPENLIPKTKTRRDRREEDEF